MVSGFLHLLEPCSLLLLVHISSLEVITFFCQQFNLIAQLVCLLLMLGFLSLNLLLQLAILAAQIIVVFNRWRLWHAGHLAHARRLSHHAHYLLIRLWVKQRANRLGMPERVNFRSFGHSVSCCLMKAFLFWNCIFNSLLSLAETFEILADRPLLIRHVHHMILLIDW